jgi:coatomer subunit beta
MFCLSCSEAFSAMLTAQEAAKKNSDGESGALAGEKRVVVDVHPDDCIAIQQLMKRDEGGVDEFAESLLRATGESGGRADKADTTTLSRVLQLTGFSDPVYAEAYVNVNQYDILLDVLVVNQTADTLQGLTLEMATRGDLKLSERPQPQTLAPHDFLNIKATVKVSSIEMGAIFGNIVYDIVGSTSDRNIVVLNDIQIDVMDYLEPAHCSITEFRDLWQENEWENLVIVESTGKTLYEQLQSLLQATNMACLTPESMLAGDCEFLAANLFARTIFGEDALANVSLERLADGKIMGHMRIRAKTQGIALSIGNKVTSKRGEK